MENLNITHRLTSLFSYWRIYTEYSSSIFMNDVNHTNEIIGAKILNKLNSWGLENLNTIKANFPAVDLGDKKNGICVSVTATSESTYIHDKIALNISNNIYKTYPTHYFLITTQKKNYTTTFDTDGKYSFDGAINILDIKDLLKKTTESDLAIQKDVLAILEEYVTKFKAHFIEDITPIDISKVLGEFSKQNPNLIKNISVRIQTIHRTSFPDKNRINKLSEGYMKLIQQQSLPFFEQFKEFLERFENREHKKVYLNIASDLQKLVLVKRTEFDKFDEIFNEIEEACKNLLPELINDRRILQVLLHFMYFQCDIGENSNDNSR